MDFIYGINPVLAALKAKRRQLGILFLKPGKPGPRLDSAIELAKRLKLRIQEVDPERLLKITGSEDHQGIALECGALPPKDLTQLLQGQGVILALDQISDPQNLGAMVRSAAFLGAKGVIHLNKKAAPLSAAASKASAGMLESFPVSLVTNLSEALRQAQGEGYFVYGAESKGGKPFTRAVSQDKLILVMGSEGEGLRDLTLKRCDELIYIPGQQGCESLNVANAAAILLQHFCPAQV